MQKTLHILKPYQEHIAITTLALIWFFLLILSGTYKSGFHLMDDHGIINFSNSLAENSYWQILKDILAHDFKIRFRPFYWVNQLFLIQVFGTNWAYWGLHHFLIAVLTSFLLFKIIRFFKLDVVISFFFAVLVLVGEQAEIFYRTSPAERSALFYLSLGVYIWLISKNQLLKVVGIICIILATLCKENFVLVIPFLVAGLFLMDFKAISIPNLFLFIKKRKWIIILFTTLVVVEISTIYLLLNNKGTYLTEVVSDTKGKSIFYYLFEIEEKLNFKGIITQVLLVITDIKRLTYLGVITFLIFLTTVSYFLGINLYKNIYKVGVFFGVLLLLLYLPQFALYLTSGISVRYFIPITLFYSIFIVYCYFITQQKNIRYLQVILLSFFSVFFIFQTLNTCIWFKKEGENLTALYEAVKEKQVDSLLIWADPAYDYEYSSSIVTYLKQIDEKLEVKYAERNKGTFASRAYLTNLWREKNKNSIENIENIENYKYVLIFDEESKRDESKLDTIISLPNYTIDSFGDITLFSRK